MTAFLRCTQALQPVPLCRPDGGRCEDVKCAPAVRFGHVRRLTVAGGRITSKRRVVTGVGAAIAMTGLKMALQTAPGKPYDGARPIGYTGPPAAMDDHRAGDNPLELRSPVTTVGPA